VLIDDHGSEVAPEVWSLYSFAVQRLGNRPTLTEWDTAIPSLETLLGEAMWADLLLGSIAFDATLARRESNTVAILPALTETARHKVKVGSCDHRNVRPARIRNFAQEEALHV